MYRIRIGLHGGGQIALHGKEQREYEKMKFVAAEKQLLGTGDLHYTLDRAEALGLVAEALNSVDAGTVQCSNWSQARIQRRSTRDACRCIDLLSARWKGAK